MPSNLRGVNLVVCRDILVDFSGSQTIIGALSEIRCVTFPFSIPKLAVYIGLEGTSPAGESITTAITPDDSLRRISWCSVSVDKTFEKRSIGVEAYFPDLVIPEPAIYRVRVFNADGEQLISRRFPVTHCTEAQLIAENEQAGRAEMMAMMPPAIVDASPIAEDEIIEIFKPHPLAIDLYREVRDFFGPVFSVVRQENGVRHSGFFCAINPRTLRVERTGAQIAMDSNSLAGVLASQLLILKSRAEGFPSFSGVLRDANWPVTDGAIPPIQSIVSVVEHEIISDELSKIGFSLKDVIFPTSPLNLNAETIALQNASKIPVPEHLKRAPWNWMYFLRWMIQRQIGQLGDAGEMKKQGRKMIPALGDDAEKMKDWLFYREFSSPQKFEKSMNDLMSIIGLPRLAFSRLEKRPDGVFIVPTNS